MHRKGSTPSSSMNAYNQLSLKQMDNVNQEHIDTSASSQDNIYATFPAYQLPQQIESQMHKGRNQQQQHQQHLMLSPSLQQKQSLQLHSSNDSALYLPKSRTDTSIAAQQGIYTPQIEPSPSSTSSFNLSIGTLNINSLPSSNQQMLLNLKDSFNPNSNMQGMSVNSVAMMNNISLLNQQQEQNQFTKSYVVVPSQENLSTNQLWQGKGLIPSSGGYIQHGDEAFMLMYREMEAQREMIERALIERQRQIDETTNRIKEHLERVMKSDNMHGYIQQAYYANQPVYDQSFIIHSHTVDGMKYSKTENETANETNLPTISQTNLPIIMNNANTQRQVLVEKRNRSFDLTSESHHDQNNKRRSISASSASLLAKSEQQQQLMHHLLYTQQQQQQKQQQQQQASILRSNSDQSISFDNKIQSSDSNSPRINDTSPHQSAFVSASSSSSSTPKFWTPEEDEALINAVNQYGQKRWKLISSMVPNRNPTQCQQRWTKVLMPGLKKGPWTPQEDELLGKLTQEQINSQATPLSSSSQISMDSSSLSQSKSRINWRKISDGIPGRTAKQCRARWINNVNPELTKERWTEEEDLKILEMYDQVGSKWSYIASNMKGRSENSVKTRCLSLVRSRSRGAGESVSSPTSSSSSWISQDES